MKAFLYDIEFAKENGVGFSILRLFLICFLSVMAICIGVIVSIIVYADRTYPINLGVIWAVLFIAAIVYTVREGQLYMAAIRTGYVVDEEKEIWLVQLTPKTVDGFGGVTNIFALIFNLSSIQKTQQKAKSEAVLIEYVKEAKAGHRYWNPLTGGEARIIQLKNLTVNNEKKKYYQCSYEKANGRTRNIKIVKAFPMFSKSLYIF